MKRRNSLPLFRIFLSSLLGLVIWSAVSWALHPRPTKTVLKDFTPSEEFLAIHNRIERKSDATGRWIATCYGELNAKRQFLWQIFDTITGQRFDAAWHADYYAHSVPIVDGYRHLRQNSDERIEIVDTRFIDGNTTVRLCLPFGTSIAS